ncbi:MAG: precorrin-2 C(20)-methyltransferase [Actinomycetota bacterium]|nr:precorrin-2 C(20)-methyltransferase [Actinomycetota bacterium]
MSGRLIAVGVGPGDPELLTLKGLRILKEADEVFVPVADTGETGRAEAVVRAHLGENPEHIERLLFALSSDDTEARARNWTNAALKVAKPLRQGKTCAFATIGDSNLYSTFSYLARAVTETIPDVKIETVPGIMAMQDLASKSGTVLLVREERLALLPFTAGKTVLRDALEEFETVVCYKGGGRLGEVLEVAGETGRLEHGIYGSRLGMEDEEIIRAPDISVHEGAYLSTVIFVRSDEMRWGI